MNLKRLDTSEFDMSQLDITEQNVAVEKVLDSRRSPSTGAPTPNRSSWRSP